MASRAGWADSQIVDTSIGLGPEMSEVLGLHLGDGCVSRYMSGGSEYYVVAFTGSGSEFWYYRDFVKPTIESTLPVHGHLYLRRDGTTRYHIFGRELAFYLIKLGIPVGRKKDAGIPAEVRERGLVVPFVRGLYHAEGSLYKRYSKMYNTHVRVYDNLHVVQIRMKLPTLMKEVHDELGKLGIVTNRLTDHDGVYTLRITDQREIRRFEEIIKPRFKTLRAQTKLI